MNHSSHARRLRRGLATFVCVVVIAASCGSDEVTQPTATAPGFPITFTDDRGRTVTVESTERIIPLDGDVAEIVFALGLGDRVVATDLSATFPAEADALPEIGYQRALNTEPIVRFDPTIVIGTDIAGPPEVLRGLQDVGVPVVIVPSEPTPAGPAEKIKAVAVALGVPHDGEDLADDVDEQIASETVADDQRGTGPRVLALYLRGTNVQLVLGEGSGIDWLIDAAGGVDVADDLGVIETEPISAEAILEAAPDVIVVPDAGLDSVGGLDGLWSIPGLEQTPAGKSRAVLAYDDQLMLGNGPRTGEFLAQFRADLTALE